MKRNSLAVVVFPLILLISGCSKNESAEEVTKRMVTELGRAHKGTAIVFRGTEEIAIISSVTETGEVSYCLNLAGQEIQCSKKLLAERIYAVNNPSQSYHQYGVLMDEFFTNSGYHRTPGE